MCKVGMTDGGIDGRLHVLCYAYMFPFCIVSPRTVDCFCLTMIWFDFKVISCKTKPTNTGRLITCFLTTPSSAPAPAFEPGTIKTADEDEDEDDDEEDDEDDEEDGTRDLSVAWGEAGGWGDTDPRLAMLLLLLPTRSLTNGRL